MDFLLNFIKKTKSNKDIQSISLDYIQGYFIFDAIATIPSLIIFQENINYFALKLARLIHIDRFIKPTAFLMQFLFKKLPKKRQNDLMGFFGLIIYVIYLSHLMSCIWIYLGL